MLCCRTHRAEENIHIFYRKANPTLTFDLTMDTVVNAPTLLNEYLLTNPMTPNSIRELVITSVMNVQPQNCTHSQPLICPQLPLILKI